MYVRIKRIDFKLKYRFIDRYVYARAENENDTGNKKSRLTFVRFSSLINILRRI